MHNQTPVPITYIMPYVSRTALQEYCEGIHV